MNILILLGLFFISAQAVKFILDLHTDYTLFGLVLSVGGSIGAVVLPIFFYALFDVKLTKRAVSKIGLAWCREHHVDYVDVSVNKTHYAVIYMDNGKQQRAKFLVQFLLTTWYVRNVTWLPK